MWHKHHDNANRAAVQLPIKANHGKPWGAKPVGLPLRVLLGEMFARLPKRTGRNIPLFEERAAPKADVT